ncbi:hypothetical protein BN8_02097 [Fibrisoma limi BUZ 3]|uniref:Uncharacterized protein n=1 Tax=Fibrisoma limi BUZ 3 TaxID=1185876 RepID=I2GGL1_9BACT|nr:hypothetical protein BN8_02097 [Fibrisoma limi BUZ 3]
MFCQFILTKSVYLSVVLDDRLKIYGYNGQLP